MFCGAEETIAVIAGWETFYAYSVRTDDVTIRSLIDTALRGKRRFLFFHGIKNDMQSWRFVPSRLVNVRLRGRLLIPLCGMNSILSRRHDGFMKVVTDSSGLMSMNFEYPRSIASGYLGMSTRTDVLRETDNCARFHAFLDCAAVPRRWSTRTLSTIDWTIDNRRIIYNLTKLSTSLRSHARRVLLILPHNCLMVGRQRAAPFNSWPIDHSK